ncbi:ubiquinol-cytochrome C chaperone-domain-containing protein [Obelidium mucronatum]|nr:ubiquinol-cytochrome C chaperone-domain-containing protein [Obelidium mucronatum]
MRRFFNRCLTTLPTLAARTQPQPACVARAPISPDACINGAPNFDMLMNPFGTIKMKMSKIDHARFAYESCSLQFYENNKFMERFNLPDNLQSWFNVTVLHVWMYNAQLKTLGPEGREMCQEIFATLLLDIEIHLNKAGVRTKLDSITSELIGAYYGQILAYDEGLALGGDAVLASALWRNVFQATDGVSAQKLLEMVEYVRLQLQHLDGKPLTDLSNPIKFLDA